MGVYQDKDNGRWYCEFMLFGKRVHKACRGVKDKSEALEFEADLKSKLSLIHRGKLPDDKIITIKEMFTAYLNHSKANKCPKAYKDDQSKVKFFKTFFGCKDNDSISEITPSRIDGLKIYLIEDKKCSKATFNRYYSALSKAFNVIIDDKELNMRNPCKSIKKFTEDNEITRYLTKEDEEKLMQELPSYLKPIVICALTTGLRASNILNLKWETINFECNFIEVLKQENKGHKKIQLPLSTKFKKELEKIGMKESGYVFVSHRTNEQYKKISNGFQAALSRAGIKKMRFHDLRHTVATRLVANGTDLRTVKEYMAHSNIRTTERYMHPTPENMLKAVDILDSF